MTKQANAKGLAKVVPLHKPAAVVLPLDSLDSFQGVKKISSLIRQWERSNKANTYNIMAKRANLCSETVRRLASGDTKAPRLQTCLCVLKALGFAVVRFEP